MKLELELVPEQQWGESLAHKLPKVVWDWFRRKIYKAGNYTCSICDTSNVEVHCHEIWHWDDQRKVQYLYGAQCLCKDCHMLKHWGLTLRLVHLGELTTKYKDELIEHFCEVNECSKEDFQAHYLEMGNLWQKRSRHLYKIDWGKWKPELLIKEYGRLK